ncbi:hypothetical protein, partial [Thermogladius sp.]|uniref:hypothetical protein n=1 Tax=Thermogladius sp. TaxID=2023064 RepID=UPI003D0BA58D
EDRLLRVSLTLQKGEKQIKRSFDIFSTLSVSEPERNGVVTAVNNLQVYKIQRTGGPARLSFVGSITAEFWEEGSLLYEVAVRRVPPSERIANIAPGLKKVFDEFQKTVEENVDELETKLLDVIRGFGCELAKAELAKIDGVSELNDYRDLLIKEVLPLCEKDKCAPVRIGFGAGHESKTIALYLMRQGLYSALSQKMSQLLNRQWDSSTVKTVTDSYGKLVGVGWCRLCLE